MADYLIDGTKLPQPEELPEKELPNCRMVVMN